MKNGCSVVTYLFSAQLQGSAHADWQPGQQLPLSYSDYPPRPCADSS
jgi:hypothetical protein